MDWDAYRKRFKGHLVESKFDFSCPVCQSDTWALGDIAKVSILGKTTYYAFIPYSCDTCGYIYWFNATTVGFTEDEIAAIRDRLDDAAEAPGDA